MVETTVIDFLTARELDFQRVPNGCKLVWQNHRCGATNARHVSQRHACNSFPCTLQIVDGFQPYLPLLCTSNRLNNLVVSFSLVDIKLKEF
jgi:hypothetical protein